MNLKVHFKFMAHYSSFNIILMLYLSTQHSNNEDFFLNLAYQAKIYATFHQEKLLSRRGQKWSLCNYLCEFVVIMKRYIDFVVSFVLSF